MIVLRWHGDLGKKKTGGKIKPHRKKRKFELGSEPMHPILRKEKIKLKRTKGGGIKIKAAAVESVNVYNPKSKKMEKVKILDIVENPANPHFVRRGIITKGCIVQTELGLVRVTSRPSQTGVASGVLVEERLKEER